MKYDCLIIDDEVTLAEATAEYFNLFGVSAAFATSFDAGREFLLANDVSLLLLDINLGACSGFDICRELRASSQLPILFISARQSDDDILFALGLGGDDYIKKPYTLSVLLAKVKAVLKRCGGAAEVVQAGEVRIDVASTKATAFERDLNLKAMEFKLLLYLVKNKNRLVSKNELFDNVWGGGIVSDSTLNVHIRRLREKLEDNPNEPRFIKTVWGGGYIFEVEA